MPFLLAFFIAIASVNVKEVQPSPADVAHRQAELALAAGRTAEARYWYQEAIGYNGEAAGISGDSALVYNLAVLNYGDGVTRNLHELLDYAAASGISAADVLLGDLYESERSGFPHDPSRAREHWQRAAAVGDNRADKIQRIVQHRHRLFEVDNVDVAPLAINIRCHLGIPETGTVPEVCACLKQLAHTDFTHSIYSIKG